MKGGDGMKIRYLFQEEKPELSSSLSEARSFLKSQELLLQRGFEDLLCLQDVSIEPKFWQRETAIKALRDMHGSAILADEVGLGKTIEAGLIMKELLHRKLISSILVLVPAPLVEQWKEEMDEKFGISLKDYKDLDWSESPFIISSLPYATRSKMRRSELQDYGFDLVIVDEAHSLKNQKTQSYKFVYKIKRKYTLLMSATPIQNDLKELFNLVNLLKPGYFKSRKLFHQDYVKDRFTPRNVMDLRRLLSDVMIRHKRSNTLVELPRRHTHALEVALSEEERNFHDGVIHYAKALYQEKLKNEEGSGTDILSLVGLLKQNCSSPASVVRYLEKNFLPNVPNAAFEKECLRLIDEGNSLDYPTKARLLVGRLKENGKQCIVYTEFLGTLSMLEKIFEQEGVTFLPYHGSLSAKQKNDTILKFKNGDAKVLLCTESGSQGLNLQTCNQLYNYDLPWNPMRIEQRIGRVHRFGQKNEVDIYTMATKGTLDEYILYVLTSKIQLFEMVIGELDTIMSYVLDDNVSLEVKIGRMILDSRSPAELQAKLEEIGEVLRKAKEEFTSQMSDTQSILDAIGVEEDE